MVTQDAAPRPPASTTRLRVATSRGASPSFWLRHGLSVYEGNHKDVDAVRIGRCQTVRAESDVAGSRIFIDLDGEQPGMLPATWRIVPATVDLLV